MQWRLSKGSHGQWYIEYKKGLLSSWQVVSGSRRYQWEPNLPKGFSTKQEAAEQMGKLIARYS